MGWVLLTEWVLSFACSLKVGETNPLSSTCAWLLLLYFTCLWDVCLSVNHVMSRHMFDTSAQLSSAQPCSELADLERETIASHSSPRSTSTSLSHSPSSRASSSRLAIATVYHSRVLTVYNQPPSQRGESLLTSTAGESRQTDKQTATHTHSHSLTHSLVQRRACCLDWCCASSTHYYSLLSLLVHFTSLSDFINLSHHSFFFLLLIFCWSCLPPLVLLFKQWARIL